MIKTVVTRNAVVRGMLKLHGMSKLVLPTTVNFLMINVKTIKTAVAACAAIFLRMISKRLSELAHRPVLLQELCVILH